MMNVVHHTGGTLEIPGHHAIKRRIMKMGEETIEKLREMFSVWLLPDSCCLRY